MLFHLLMKLLLALVVSWTFLKKSLAAAPVAICISETFSLEKDPIQNIGTHKVRIFRKESYFNVAERKCDKRKIGKDPTMELINIQLDSVRI